MVATGEQFSKLDLESVRTNPYLNRQLLAYIGNKRALLPFLFQVFSTLVPDRVRSPRTRPVFLDPFAGTGAVSRLARVAGFDVHANDWEYYSALFNGCFLGIGASRAQRLFGGNSEGVFELLNAIGSETDPDTDKGNFYISRYYAPRSTHDADYRRERMFYTAENARFIDRVRDEVEERYPGWDLEPRAKDEKLMIVAAILLEAATHANTSGVFKAYHKGFGGHGRDALGRILAPMRLELPRLIDAPGHSTVSCLDATEFVRSRPADIAYLDPPYTIHQYGSNYFMLNTIARWDRPVVSMDRGSDGRLVEKAAIRKDWVDTRSAYCYAKTAGAAFRALVDAIDARHIAVSYNTEGLIPLEELAEILSARGRLTLHGSDYTKYRGGKQSLARTIGNVEFVVVVDTDERVGPGDRERDMRRVAQFRLRKRAGMLVRKAFVPQRVREQFRTYGDAIVLTDPLDREVGRAAMDGFSRFRGTVRVIPVGAVPESTGGTGTLGDYLDSLSVAALERFVDRLSACVCRDNREEAEVLISRLRESVVSGRGGGGAEPSGTNPRELVARLFVVTRKLAARKHRAVFETVIEQVRMLARQFRAASATTRIAERVESEMEQLEELARRRFSG